MTIKDLKDILDFYIRIGDGDNTVVVGLKEPSVAHSANSPVKYAYNGIDFDNNTFFLECEDKLRRHDKDRDKPMTAVKIIYTKYPETRPVIHCPICENKLRKADKYCSNCGQAVSMENLREFKI